MSDEDLQAQAWFPGTLTAMLHCAEQAATTTLNDSSKAIWPLSVQNSSACYPFNAFVVHESLIVCIAAVVSSRTNNSLQIHRFGASA